MTGYLTQRGMPDRNWVKLAIPNMEIRSIFTDQILAMFKENVANDGVLLKNFCSALERGDSAEVENLLGFYLRKTISIRDTFVRKATKENFYHGILLGILGYKEGWILKSNRESGDGQLQAVCRDAIRQIDRNGYVKELKNEGCHTILKYGIACRKKECCVIVERENI